MADHHRRRGAARRLTAQRRSKRSEVASSLSSLGGLYAEALSGRDCPPGAYLFVAVASAIFTFGATMTTYFENVRIMRSLHLT
jgi:hypothetical protein